MVHRAVGDDLRFGLVGDPRQYAGLDQPLGPPGRRLVGGGAVLVSVFVVSGIIGWVVDKAMGFRIDEEHEMTCADLMVHAESAYDLHATAGARSAGPSVLGDTARREEKS